MARIHGKKRLSSLTEVLEEPPQVVVGSSVSKQFQSGYTVGREIDPVFVEVHPDTGKL